MQPQWQGAPDEGIVGVLLAAGHGTRFDASARRHKLLEPYPPGQPGAPPLVIAAARNLLAAGPVLAVVRDVPAGAPGPGETPAAEPRQRLRQLLAAAGCRVISYAGPATDAPRDAGAPEGGQDEGTGASIACAVRASAGAAGWIIALGDMPRIRPQTIAAVRRALQDGALTAAPYYRGQRGHPVGFGAACGAALAALAGDAGARSILQRHPPLRVDVDDPGILFDVDRPEDLQDPPAGAGPGC